MLPEKQEPEVKQQEPKKLQDFTLIELKALVYDLSAEITMRTQTVNAINEEIRKRGQLPGTQ